MTGTPYVRSLTKQLSVIALRKVTVDDLELLKFSDFRSWIGRTDILLQR